MPKNGKTPIESLSGFMHIIWSVFPISPYINTLCLYFASYNRDVFLKKGHYQLWLWLTAGRSHPQIKFSTAARVGILKAFPPVGLMGLFPTTSPVFELDHDWSGLSSMEMYGDDLSKISNISTSTQTIFVFMVPNRRRRPLLTTAKVSVKCPGWMLRYRGGAKYMAGRSKTWATSWKKSQCISILKAVGSVELPYKAYNTS